MGLRRKAREMALQTLFALDFQEKDGEFGELELLNHFEEVLTEIASSDNITAEDPRYAFAEDIVRLTIKHLGEIDSVISKHTKNWSIERLASIDRNILRLAIAEMYYSETPAPIIINEAIEIAKRFSTEQSGKFVNGILDKIQSEHIKNGS
ncbi:MAG TPA: transcription antitermination factor NusB [Candidatus Cloacimonadota bacterium]|nr:transcription antitermination factor NusB [Candidatus Cloacimonadota bacterium]HPT72289.1 transcription antitermination factor NusB [Candidatus Cloacimonadota bacterium]